MLQIKSFFTLNHLSFGVCSCFVFYAEEGLPFKISDNFLVLSFETLCLDIKIMYYKVLNFEISRFYMLETGCICLTLPY